MKLILCPHCYDVVKLVTDRRDCMCGLCWGWYEDNLNAFYNCNAIPIGFDNHTLAKALLEQPTKGMGKTFKAFVIPKECATFKRLANE